MFNNRLHLQLCHPIHGHTHHLQCPENLSLRRVPAWTTQNRGGSRYPQLLAVFNQFVAFISLQLFESDKMAVATKMLHGSSELSVCS